MSKPIIRIELVNANPSLCAPCGGQCCQNAPGHVFPGDVDPTLDRSALRTKLRAMLQSGRYALDHFVGDPFQTEGTPSLQLQAWVVRPAIRGQEGRWVDDSWGGPCTFHTPTGCSLSDDTRPSECKALVPRPDEQCAMPDDWQGLRTAAQAWWPYRLILEGLKAEYYAS